MKNKITKNFNELLCYLFGHQLKFNFPINSMPDKCICKRCRIKGKINYKTFSFDYVDEFSKDLGTDEELIKRWFQG
jgi:hypothetical protein